MAAPDRYPIPAARARAELVIERSRFIATVAHAATPEAAHGVIAELREAFRDATHNCWAFVAGPPGSAARIGMSDDGEPHGTAGRPMLTVLMHSGVGEVVAVVTRYYGGTKLGTGGLVRAYSAAVQEALARLERTERVETVDVRIAIAYSAFTPVRNLLGAHEGVVLEEQFGEDVVLNVRLPAANLAALRGAIGNATGGQGRVVLEG